MTDNSRASGTATQDLSRKRPDQRMVEGPILSTLLKLTFPIMVNNLLQVLSQLIDVFWLGRLGPEAVASLTLALPLWFLVVSLGIGLGIAASTLLAQYAGSRNAQLLNHTAAQSLVTATGAAVFLGIVGMVLAPALLRTLAAAPDVYDGAVGFLRVTFAALPLTFVFYILQAQLRAIGRPAITLYMTALTILINFFADPILIFGLFGFPALGVVGAAVATALAQLPAAVLALGYFASGRSQISFAAQDFKFNATTARKLFTLGYPASIQQSIRAIVSVTMVFIVSGLGTIAIASYGVAMNVLNFATIPALGFALASSTFIGQNLGASKPDRAWEIARVSIVVTVVALSLLGAVCYLFSAQIAVFLIPDNALVNGESAKLVRIVAFAFALVGLQNVFIGTLRASGLMKLTMTITIVSQLLIQVPAAYFLVRYSFIGVAGLAWIVVLGNALAAAIGAFYVSQKTWLTNRLLIPSGRSA